MKCFSIKLYCTTLTKSFKLLFKNIPAYILFTIYLAIFYLGIYFYFNKDYIHSTLLFFVFSFCISSIFYIMKKIIEKGHFSINDFFKSFKKYYIRANFTLIFWFATYFLINLFVISPISSVVKGWIILYFIKIPLILLIFFAFNSLIEEIYLSKDTFESIFINSINFLEKYWNIWILPNILILFLWNILDARFSIMPTLGYLNSYEAIARITDYSFYIQTFIITLSLIYRGVLYTNIKKLASHI